MNLIRMTVAAAVLACGAAVAAEPDWLRDPSVSMHLVWKRVDEQPQMEVRDGVCVVYMPARSERSIVPMDDLLARCEAQGARVVSDPPADAFVLHWHRTTSEAEIKARMNTLMGARPGTVYGFYYRPDPAGPCHIVTNVGYPVAGHETLHCVLGNFHVEDVGWQRGQRWLLGPGRQQQDAWKRHALPR